jgi:hypothetical protein
LMVLYLCISPIIFLFELIYANKERFKVMSITKIDIKMNVSPYQWHFSIQTTICEMPLNCFIF